MSPAKSSPPARCHHKADEAKRECDGTHLARSANATVHSFHVQWAKVAMCGQRTPVIFVFVLPLNQTAGSCSSTRSGTSIVCECVGNVFLVLYVFSVKHRPPWQELIVLVKP